MEIDLVKIVKSNLTINEYLTLVMLDKKENGIDFPFTSTIKTVNILKEEEYLTVDNRDMVYLTSKAKDLINPKQNIDFDELFFMYPAKTPRERILRTKNKEVRGKLTKEYKSLKDKYLSKVKTSIDHNEVLVATKAMITDKKNRGALEYMRQLEVYINRQEWEQYVGEEVKDRSNSDNWERI